MKQTGDNDFRFNTSLNNKGKKLNLISDQLVARIETNIENIIFEAENNKDFTIFKKIGNEHKVFITPQSKVDVYNYLSLAKNVFSKFKKSRKKPNGSLLKPIIKASQREKLII